MDNAILLSEHELTRFDGRRHDFWGKKRAHNPKVVSSNLTPATTKSELKRARIFSSTDATPPAWTPNWVSRGGELYGVLMLDVYEGRINSLFAVLNSDKLRSLARQLGMC